MLIGLFKVAENYFMRKFSMAILFFENVFFLMPNQYCVTYSTYAQF
jgi:hypothetical protein